MKHDRLEAMVKGWFVGGFAPAALATTACEVAVKTYRQGDYELAHVHRIATETTLILSGRVRMAGYEWGPGDIVTISPGEATDFLALADAVTVVVKVPGALGDKYPADSTA